MLMKALRMPELDSRVTRLLHLSTMMLAITSFPPQLHVFHIPQEELIGSLNLGEGGDVTAMLHPATWLNKIVLGRESGNVQIWNVRTGYSLATNLLRKESCFTKRSHLAVLSQLWRNHLLWTSSV